MAFRATCVVLLLSSLPIAGCGTVANLVNCNPEEGGVSPFGGVRQDMECIETAANGETVVTTYTKPAPGQHPQTALMLLYAADLPFSFIGDVVTWPYTAAYSWINQPIPVPAVTQAMTEGPPQTGFPPGYKEPETKTSDRDADRSKQKDDTPSQLPPPTPLPRTLPPPAD
jgi:uncharacterized protein YceK